MKDLSFVRVAKLNREHGRWCTTHCNKLLPPCGVTDHQQCYRGAGWLPPPHHCGVGQGCKTWYRLLGQVPWLNRQGQGSQGWSICHFRILLLSLTGTVYSSILKMETSEMLVSLPPAYVALHCGRGCVKLQQNWTHSHQLFMYEMPPYLSIRRTEPLRQDMGHSKCNTSNRKHTQQQTQLYIHKCLPVCGTKIHCITLHSRYVSLLPTSYSNN
jgi:hypothetical protein